MEFFRYDTNNNICNKKNHLPTRNTSYVSEQRFGLVLGFVWISTCHLVSNISLTNCFQISDAVFAKGSLQIPKILP